jgi:hypothetical protein
MSAKERKISERSLENLKLGAQARYQGKARHNFTVLPETVEWLKATGNASDTIDALVASARNGGLTSKNTHDWKDKEQSLSNDVYEEINQLKKENEQMRVELQKLKAAEKDVTNQLCDCHSDAFKAADILKAAIKLPANKGGAIKREIEKALPLIDDV